MTGLTLRNRNIVILLIYSEQVTNFREEQYSKVENIKLLFVQRITYNIQQQLLQVELWKQT